ncbi:MAG: molybdopterin molybdotransferase MoeA [Pirellulales bacterium]|nr:molybdopterin molybdotransferase MoeA [Pirellulales bacterium]
MASKFKYDQPNDALDALAERLAVVGIEASSTELVGRTLAGPITADRDSPAADVSAMDGYAVRGDDLNRDDPVPVVGESTPGEPPPPLPHGAAVRIFTGAIVPAGCQVVIKREDTEELDGAVRWLDSARQTPLGEHIRRAGENAPQGGVIQETGTRITAATIAAMANFGAYHADLFAPVRVSILTSGNEVGLFENETPHPWQLRNSNRFSVSALLTRAGVEIRRIEHCQDEVDQLASRLAEQLDQSNAVILTCGVSMGDYDFVPDVVQRVGGEIIFHGLPVRPGKPILGAATAAGKLLVGLPGNPVSATIGCHRFVIPLLAKMGGQQPWRLPCPTVRLDQAGEKTIPLHWMRLVRLIDDGLAQPVLSQGSGDLVSLGQSTGYVELPPGASGEGPWPYRPW